MSKTLTGQKDFTKVIRLEEKGVGVTAELEAQLTLAPAQPVSLLMKLTKSTVFR